MNILLSESELNMLKSRDKVPLKCKQCQLTFYRPKNRIDAALSDDELTLDFCSPKCNGKFFDRREIVNCKLCNKQIKKSHKDIKKSKNHFCSSSCAATYNNTHKTHGYRRSKLELWLETKLPISYPHLEFHFNRKDTISSELDIYIPSLKLAFELNGIFHYEPIYGKEQLAKIKNNDNRKFQACIERGIELCIIDSSKQRRFTEKTSRKYLDIINNIIKMKCGVSSRNRTEAL